MKRSYLYIFVLLCVIFSPLSVFAEMKYEPLGFRDIPWGAPPPENNISGSDKLDMVLDSLRSSDDMFVYHRKNENLVVAGANLTEIAYTFAKELGFCRVEMVFHETENYELLYKACIGLWGEPTGKYEVNNDGKGSAAYLSWDGKNVTISMSFIEDDGHNLPYPTRGDFSIALAALYDSPWMRLERNEQKRKGF